MSGAGAVKRCLVVYATPEWQCQWPVELPADASVQDALVAAARIATPRLEVPWNEAAVGIFGQPCERSAIPREGDRIEIYRPLRHDPKQARRERVRRRV